MISSYIDRLLFKGVPDGKVWKKVFTNVENVKNLSAYMHKLNMKYAIFYNKKYNRVG